MLVIKNILLIILLVIFLKIWNVILLKIEKGEL